MLIRLAAIEEIIVNADSIGGKAKYYISEIYINPNHIVMMEEDLTFIKLLIEKKLPDGFSQEQKFTKLIINGNKEITIIGDLGGIAAKLNGIKNGN